MFQEPQDLCFLSPHKMLYMWMQIPSYTLQLRVICRVYLGEISHLQLERPITEVRVYR